MLMKNTKQILLLITLVVGLALLQGCSSPLRGFFSSVRVSVDDDYSHLFLDSEYSQKVEVSGIQVFTQQVSCGYAILQILAQWQGMNLTEDDLFKMNNNKVSTSIGNGFEQEITKQFPQWNVTRLVNCSNTALLEKVYNSLKQGFPVPFEWAAQDTLGNWTLHFSLITALDFKNDVVQIANPYGYMQEISIQELIKATRYESYENMEWYFETGFNVGLFNQNTIYLIQKK